MGQFRSSSSQLWTFFLFTLPCNNRCSQGEVIKNRVKASPLLLSPLCPFSCQEKKTSSNCLRVTGGICGEPEKSCPARPSRALLTLPLWKEQDNKQITEKKNDTVVLRENQDSADRKKKLSSVPQTEFQLCWNIHSCHTSRTNLWNCEADRSRALARTQVSVGVPPLIFS